MNAKIVDMLMGQREDRNLALEIMKRYNLSELININAELSKRKNYHSNGIEDDWVFLKIFELIISIESKKLLNDE